MKTVSEIESLKTVYDEERVELQTSNSYKKNEQKRLKTTKINFLESLILAQD